MTVPITLGSPHGFTGFVRLGVEHGIILCCHILTRIP
jgi:hypothetical protein